MYIIQKLIYLFVNYTPSRWTNEHPAAPVGGHDTSKPTVHPKIKQVATLNRPTSSFCKVFLKRNLCHNYSKRNIWLRTSDLKDFINKTTYLCMCVYVNV